MTPVQQTLAAISSECLEGPHHKWGLSLTYPSVRRRPFIADHKNIDIIAES